MRAWWIFMLLVYCLPGFVLAQTEAEAATAVLDVCNDSSYKQHIRHTFFTGERVRVVLRDSTTKVKGRLTAVRDSSIAISNQEVEISEIISIKSPPDVGTSVVGYIMLLLSLASGFGGFIFLRAMVLKSPDNWWQWTLVVLGLLLMAFLLPLFLLGALIFWEFSKHKYLIGKGNNLQVRHIDRKVAPREPIR